jgi:hypothetical protein
METVSQFGKKWDVRVPRHAIHHWVNRQHVGMEDSEIARIIGAECEKKRDTNDGWKALKDREFATIVRQSVKFAIICHDRNIALFVKVQRGRL